MRRTSWTAGLALSVALIGAAHAAPFAPYKDELFAYPGPVASLDGGRRLDVPYSERRDIDARDEIPERRVRRAYVDLGTIGRADDRVLETPEGPLRFAMVGTPARGGPILVFVHGRNGDRRLGMNDWSFGGNFNRLKNLLVRGGGAYATIDAGPLADDDATRAGRLLAALRRDHPSSLLVLACASMGGQVCWSLATRAEAKTFDAMVLVGSDSSVENIRAMRRARVSAMPILMAHGTRDKVYPFDKQLSIFETVRRDDPTYPIRFVGFEDGNHGTPVRMIDWRDTLNWIATEVSPASMR